MGCWTTEPAEIDQALRQFFLAIGQPPPSLQRDRRTGLQTANAIRAALAR